jgi:hypothetical protein
MSKRTCTNGQRNTPRKFQNIRKWKRWNSYPGLPRNLSIQPKHFRENDEPVDLGFQQWAGANELQIYSAIENLQYRSRKQNKFTISSQAAGR